MCISGKVALDMENNMLRKDNKIKFGGCFQILMIDTQIYITSCNFDWAKNYLGPKYSLKVPTSAQRELFCLCLLKILTYL